jgi:transcriptional regulator with XRE-family HTH domain
MARRIPALVKPELLVWARESAGITSLDQAVDLIGEDSVTLQEWENGHDSPSLTDLRKKGEVYKRPIAVFFLSELNWKF